MQLHSADLSGFPSRAPGAPLRNGSITPPFEENGVASPIEDMERDGYSRIDVTEEAEKTWAQEVEAVSDQSLHKFADSWYNGKNIEGKKGGFMVYVGGFPRYSQLSEEAVRDGYTGFMRN